MVAQRWSSSTASITVVVFGVTVGAIPVVKEAVMVSARIMAITMVVAGVPYP